jgi:hypothetical protein
MDGKIVTLSASSLRISVSGLALQRDVSSAQVLQIERWTKDSVMDGTLVGTFFGVVSGAALTVVACSVVRCSNHTGGVLATLGIFAGAGAGIGALTDAAMMKRESVYRASKQTSRLNIAPYFAGRSKAVQLSVRF